MRRLWSGVAELDTRVPDALQRHLLTTGVHLMARASRRLLRDLGGRLRIAERIARYREGVATLIAGLPELVDEAHRETLQAAAAPLEEAGVPADLALWVAGFDRLARAFDIVEVAEGCSVEVGEAARVYFALGAMLDLDLLARQVSALPTQDRWLAGARNALRDELLEHHSALASAVLKAGMAEASATSRLATWKHQHHAAVDEWLRLLGELRQHDEPDVARLTVALRAVGRLVAATRSRA
jgi:glutamate dehydrogenase